MKTLLTIIPKKRLRNKIMAKVPGNSKGFTLVETAVVLVIGSLILTMLFSSLNIYLKNSKLNTTRERMAEIEKQIQTYLNYQGHLPCPAELGQIAIDNPNYGTETDCQAAALANRTFGNANVRIGMVPTRTLNLPDDFGYDAWGNRLVYAVTRNLAQTPAQYDPTQGRINIIDSNGNTTLPTANTAHYVVISPGINRRGGYNINGAIGINCPAATALENENCDNDATFRNTVLVSDNGGDNEFDDLLISGSTSDFGQTIPSGAVILFRLPACPDGWAQSSVASPNTDHRYCRKN